MPGSFILDTTAAPPKLDLHTGAPGSHLYQPPQTSSAASSLHQSIASDRFSFSSQSTRKRPRYNYVDDSEETAGFYSTGTASPAGLVNSQYSLADGLDTPTDSISVAYEKQAFEALNAEHDYRRNRVNQYSHTGDGYFPSTPAGPLSRERNGRTRTTPQNTPNKWSRTVFNVVGSVAGKVWEFCWAGAFSGFYAGGGKGYEMKQPTSSTGWPPMSEKHDVFNDEYRAETPIPGGFPGDDLIPDYMSRNHTSSPPRASKKVLREHSDAGLRGNWVIVNHSPQSRDGSPVRSATRKVPRQQNPSLRRPVTASRPGKRPILAPSRPSLMSHAGSTAVHSRPTSAASNKSFGIPILKPPAKPDSKDSPLSPEAQRQITRARKQKRQEDASIRRMTQQLDVLIKQGREALGTKVEIEDEGDDEVEENEGVIDEGYAEGGLELEKSRPWEDSLSGDVGSRWR